MQISIPLEHQKAWLIGNQLDVSGNAGQVREGGAWQVNKRTGKAVVNSETLYCNFWNS